MGDTMNAMPVSEERTKVSLEWLEAHCSGVRMKLALSLIRRDGGTQPRAVIDSTVAHDYAAAMKAGAQFPPVTVFYDGMDYWLADGFHRRDAVNWLGLKEIDCEVHQGSREDAQWYSFSVNACHGQPRSEEDRKRQIIGALTHERGREMTDHAIAQHVKCSQQWVTKVRAELVSNNQLLDTPVRTVTRKGKTYQQNVTNIGKGKRNDKTQAAAGLDGHRRVSPPDGSRPSAQEEQEQSASLTQSEEQPNCDRQVAGSTPAAGSTRKTSRRMRIEHLAESTLKFLQDSKHLAVLAEWLGEKAGDFQGAEDALTSVMTVMQSVIVAIEQEAIKADPANRSRLEIIA